MGLADVLGQLLPVEVEDDGALTVRHDGTFASLRTVQIADGLEIVSLNQLLAWDLRADDDLRARVATQAPNSLFGTVTMTENADGDAEVMRRYNVPAGGLDDLALQTLVLLVLAGGADIRRSLI